MSLSRLGSLGIPVKEILMNTPAQELFNKCVVSQEFNEYCSNDNFWKEYFYKYTRIKTPVTPLKYKQTTRLVYHFLNRLWENPTLKLVSTYGLDQILKFWIDTYETYDEFLDRLNRIVVEFNKNPTNIFSFQTFAKIYPEINADYTVNEVMDDYYEYLYPNNYNPNTQYLIPEVIKILGTRVTYIVRDQPTSNQRLVNLAFNPDDAMKFLVQRQEEQTVDSPELDEIQNFVQFAADNFE
jgi:hypothetical protein